MRILIWNVAALAIAAILALTMASASTEPEQPAATAAGVADAGKCTDCKDSNACGDCGSGCGGCATSAAVPGSAALTGHELYLVLDRMAGGRQAALVRATLLAQEGVIEVVADAETRTAIVMRDPRVATTGKLLKALATAGYPPQVQPVATGFFDVDGICCNGCWSKIAGALRAVNGVRRVGWDAELGVLTVAHAPGAVQHSAIRRAIEALNDEQHNYVPYVQTRAIDLMVAGMESETCERVIAAAITQRVDAVDLFVSHVTGQVLVQVPRGSHQVGAVIDAISSLGYHVREIVSTGADACGNGCDETKTAATEYGSGSKTAVAVSQAAGDCCGDCTAGECGSCDSCGN